MICYQGQCLCAYGQHFNESLARCVDGLCRMCMRRSPIYCQTATALPAAICAPSTPSATRATATAAATHASTLTLPPTSALAVRRPRRWACTDMPADRHGTTAREKDLAETVFFVNATDAPDKYPAVRVDCNASGLIMLAAARFPRRLLAQRVASVLQREFCDVRLLRRAICRYLAQLGLLQACYALLHLFPCASLSQYVHVARRGGVPARELHQKHQVRPRQLRAADVQQPAACLQASAV